MAVTFLEPGGDATFNVAAITAGGFWTAVSATIATDFVHGNHQKSIKYTSGGAARAAAGTASDTGTRIDYFFYINAFPTADITQFIVLSPSPTFNTIIKLKLTTAGVLQLFEATNQIGTNGATLSLGQWYRISLAYTITSTSVNRFELFVNGISSISITNATLTNTGSNSVQWGSAAADATLNVRTSDHYVDDSNSLADPGNIWVTAKRPVANGTLNEWITQIGVGGSGYGSGHAPQVNERAVSTTNGWSIQNAAKKTEEYTIELASVGDINIAGSTVIDYMGWVNAKVDVNSTANIIVGGSASNISLTTAYGLFTKVAGSTTYPTGNTDIGIDTNTVNQLFSLADCGIMVAYIPNLITSSPFPSHLRV